MRARVEGAAAVVWRGRGAGDVRAGRNDRALLDRGARRRLFVAVPVASGVRYAPGPFIGGAKGSEAAHYDETRCGEDGLAGRAKENAG